MPNGLFTLKQQVLAIQEGAWPNQKTPTVDYLVVAGGGGGGYTGGGGAGGLLQGNIGVASGTAVTVTVGSGGAGTASGADTGAKGASSVFGGISADGGGAGLANYTALASKNTGGSGGGGAIESRPSGQGVAGQGNLGGSGSASNAGGGGGAGTAGINATSFSGNGGAGIASPISGTVTAYAGGGGGGSSTSFNSNFGLGGIGGGGNATATNGVNGSANTGGGGGGASFTNPTFGTGGAGGSGVVIISYPDVYAAPTATTGSPTVSTSGSGSISFSGTQYLDYASATPLALSSGDFTFECWFYKTDSADVTVFAQVTGGFALDITPANGTIDVSVAGTSYILRAAQSVSNNTWNHVACTRSGNTFTIYYNGVSIGTATNSSTFTNNTTRVARAASGGQFTGHISNLRLVKGVVVYTGVFTPSAAPLRATQPAATNISAITGTQTSLLLNSVSGAFLADGSTNGYYPTVIGSPTWNQLSPFATGLGFKNRVYTWTSSGSITF